MQFLEGAAYESDGSGLVGSEASVIVETDTLY